MKLRNIIGALALTTFIFAFNSCKDNQAPSKKIIGTYNGSFSGQWDGNDTLIDTTPGFVVTVTELSDNKVYIEGSLFTNFEVLITNSGLNVEPVSSESWLPQFLYSGDSEELYFEYNEGNNTALYTGIKN